MMTAPSDRTVRRCIFKILIIYFPHNCLLRLMNELFL